MHNPFRISSRLLAVLIAGLTFPSILWEASTARTITSATIPTLSTPGTSASCDDAGSSKTAGVRFVGRFVSADPRTMTVTAKFRDGRTRKWPMTADSIKEVDQLRRGDMISLVYLPSKPISMNEVPKNPTVFVSLTTDEGCACHQFDSTGHCAGTCSGKCPSEFPYCIIYPGFTTSRACVCSKTP
jgi:hypothetical protein